MRHDTAKPAVPLLDYASRSTPPPERHRPVVAAALGLGLFGLIALPVLFAASGSGARINDVRTACASNLRSVGQVVEMYAADHGGAYPDTLTELYPEYVRDVRIFVCPSSDDTPAEGATSAAKAANLTAGGHLSYVYLGRGLNRRAGADVVLAFEWPAHHADEGERTGPANVLFADGHVERFKDLRPILDPFAAGVRPVRVAPAKRR